MSVMRTCLLRIVSVFWGFTCENFRINKSVHGKSVHYKEVSAVEAVCYREVSLYAINGDLTILKKGA